MKLDYKLKQAIRALLFNTRFDIQWDGKDCRTGSIRECGKYRLAFVYYDNSERLTRFRVQCSDKYHQVPEAIALLHNKIIAIAPDMKLSDYDSDGKESKLDSVTTLLHPNFQG